MQIAIVIDIAFMVVVFLFVSLVRPDLHISVDRCSSFATGYRSGPKQKMLVQMKIGKQANGNASPIKRREGEQIEERRNCLRHKIVRWFPIPTSKR